MFSSQIFQGGTGKKSELPVGRRWEQQTRPPQQGLEKPEKRTSFLRHT